MNENRSVPIRYEPNGTRMDNFRATKDRFGPRSGPESNTSKNSERFLNFLT